MQITNAPGEFDLPSHARITFNVLDKALDDLPPTSLVLQIELLDAIRIECTRDQNSAGYWVSAKRYAENGSPDELALRFASNKQALARAVELLSRQVS